jgi:hypothetical protein
MRGRFGRDWPKSLFSLSRLAFMSPKKKPRSSRDEQGYCEGGAADDKGEADRASALQLRKTLY